jgi:S-formylglutathione hydrolase|uniref:S-formylglutathione hydrolase n=1 Tax=Eutreptiella gymnastica TaxID=73025 RepID=A0A7S4CRJ3_9EUGL|mmetsp:Transcript_59678/g.98989  ORF Transcript_59678/g.98989 Transcript_59678/m.98989 type:complete len:292 (-) Transcript_59678:645-1520(-)|eukprot:CAMPEP_0174296492 /NCGR_PEP_ID=MMETSP0809-20121228/48040_1 /TAXON_ID=73025 ORGANISM="Eutreptiella gymnastica-like, Strain CCMP1594" /NCGR_SAMPLE_ID=MMETSP0809 /ASSEMBLY_ACC=CAM_ASM_000658 /LENGTH=291 /DNA_ID=CAMNT_0015399529 /DNA_START=13 /DNA_END=888 /DNA_ORIENTATION=-
MATKLSEAKMFGGTWLRLKHDSKTVGTPMEFSVYLPPKAVGGEKVKCVYYLSGLTCTDKNVMEKSGIQRAASVYNVAIVAPDTSPRNPPEAKIPGEDDSWDFGSGAGFYVDATQEPWNKQYKMYSYVTKELPELLATEMPMILTGSENTGIMGHSMGGHGAITIALKNPDKYKSLSAFAPICNPINCPWGKKNLGNYLGEDTSTWTPYDSTELAKAYAGPKFHLLVSQGTKDTFLERELMPEALKAAVESNNNLTIDLHMDEGYDHSYCYIATEIEAHIKHHAAILGDPGR